jgi:NitT/TauT family transport system substrate-binding protein
MGTRVTTDRTRGRFMRHIACGLIIVFLGAAVAGFAAGPAWSALPKVTMLWVAVTGSQAVAWVTKEAGYFTRNGVDVDLVYLAGSPVAAATLVSGRVEFVQMAGPAVISANARGAHLVMVMGFVNQPVFVVMTTPDITTPEQLKGKTVAVTRVGSSDDFMLREALSHWGLRPDTDVMITGVGTVAGQIAAIEKRLVAGVVVDAPNDVLAQQAGARVLARVSDLGIPYQAAGLVTTREYIRSHPEVVARVVRAMTEGVHHIKTNRAFSEEIMAKYLKNTNPLVVDAAYEAYVNIFPRAPVPSKTGLAEIMKESVSTGLLKDPIDVSAMLDTSFVDSLQKNGFIQQLYAK